MTVSAILLATAVTASSAAPAAASSLDAQHVYDNTALTTSLGNWEAEPIEVWLATQPVPRPFRANVVAHAGPMTAPTFIILMEEGLYDSLGASVMSEWMGDMVAQGYVVDAVEITYSTVQEVRGYLSDAYAQGLEGMVLIGDLPVPLSAFEWPGVSSEIFPSDYYFMDLDGTWEDNWIGYPSAQNPGSDGRFDTWSGSLDPEIFAARMQTSNLQGEEVDLLEAYLDRAHDWRQNGDPEPITALCYVDDDWAAWGPQYQSAMQM
ncbi:hypothetical protein JW921_06205, partial [Candidatus Fermentibacterales bacterium]|nr:hypothetical protein [Candidatus Fermentibacterales bacterium]